MRGRAPFDGTRAGEPHRSTGLDRMKRGERPGTCDAAVPGMHPRISLLVYGLPLVLAACVVSMGESSPGRSGVAEVQASEPGFRATGSPAPPVDPRSTLAANALGAQDYALVLALTENTKDSDVGAWLDYDRAAALTGLQRTDEAVEVFERAEERFRAGGDEYGRAKAVWGRARALAGAGRCAEARLAFDDYRQLVRLEDPRGAEMAAAESAACRTPVLLQ